MISLENEFVLKIFGSLPDISALGEKQKQIVISTIIDSIRSDRHTKANIEEIATNYPKLVPLLLEIVRIGFRHHKRWLNTLLILK